MLCFFLVINFQALAQGVLNIYAWGGVIPSKLIHQFEIKENVKVNFSTFDSNEMMYAKLATLKNQQYDLVEPSSYYVERMIKNKMLAPINHGKLSNYNQLASSFKNPSYDPNNQYSIPYIWGITGIFQNKANATHLIQSWNDLWKHQYRSQLVLLDDAREVFSMALLALGYSPNDTNPQHIQQAYQKLLVLLPNVKMFASDNIQSIVADDDVSTGMIWNGDVVKIHEDNQDIEFIYPKEGFVMWVDTFVILKNSPNKENAYKFINFMLSNEAAKIEVKEAGFASTNRSIEKTFRTLKIKNLNYPPANILKRGYFQRDVGQQALKLYAYYWQKLKLSA